MARPPKVAKLLVSTVPLTLEVDGGAIKLPLKLAWTMRCVLLIESRLRLAGIQVNILQDIRGYWSQMDYTRLTAGVWAAALQEQPEYSDEDGFEAISSFITPDNASRATDALWEAFLESLSPDKREAIKKAAEEEGKPAPPPDPPPVQN